MAGLGHAGYLVVLLAFALGLAAAAVWRRP